MELIIEILIFHLFYGITYVLTWDIIKYHQEKKIPLPPFLKKQQIFCCITYILVFFLGPTLLQMLDTPFPLAAVAYLIFGMLFTKDVWTIYQCNMVKYQDFYYYKYAKLDPFYLRNYIQQQETEDTSWVAVEKMKEIKAFMKPYPYLLKVKKSGGINAYSDLEKKEIVMTSGCFLLPTDEIKALLAHEIMHFQVDGKVSTKKKKILLFATIYLIYLGFLISAFFLRKTFPIIKIFFLFLLLFFTLYVAFFHIILPERYLYQWSELKCDRLACSLEGVDRKAMIHLLERLRKKKTKKEVWYLKIIRRYFLFAAHPNINFRIKKLEKYRKWSILDYLTLPPHLIYRLLIGKGWSDN